MIISACNYRVDTPFLFCFFPIDQRHPATPSIKLTKTSSPILFENHLTLITIKLHLTLSSPALEVLTRIIDCVNLTELNFAS